MLVSNVYIAETKTKKIFVYYIFKIILIVTWNYFYYSSSWTQERVTVILCTVALKVYVRMTNLIY